MTKSKKGNPDKKKMELINDLKVVKCSVYSKNGGKSL